MQHQQQPHYPHSYQSNRTPTHPDQYHHPPQPQMQQMTNGYQQPVSPPYQSGPPPSVPYSQTIAAGISGPYQPQQHHQQQQMHPPHQQQQPPLVQTPQDDIPLTFSPPPPHVQQSIDSSIDYLQQYPNMLSSMSAQMNDQGRPAYDFLHPNTPHHEYYLWRKYFLEQGIDARRLNERCERYRRELGLSSPPPSTAPLSRQTSNESITSQQSQQHQQPIDYDPLGLLLSSPPSNCPPLSPPQAENEFQSLLTGLTTPHHPGSGALERVQAFFMHQSHDYSALMRMFECFRQRMVTLHDHGLQIEMVNLIHFIAQSGTPLIWRAMLPSILPLFIHVFLSDQDGSNQSVLIRFLDDWQSKGLVPGPNTVITIKQELQKSQLAPPPSSTAPSSHMIAPTGSPLAPSSTMTTPTAAASSATPAATVVTDTHLPAAYIVQLAQQANTTQALASGRANTTYTPIDPSRLPPELPTDAIAKEQQRFPSSTYIKEKIADFDSELSKLLAHSKRRSSGTSSRSNSRSRSPSPNKRSSGFTSSRRRPSHSRSRSRSRSRSPHGARSRGSSSGGRRSRSHSHSPRRSGGGGGSDSKSRASYNESRGGGRRSSRSRSRSRSPSSRSRHHHYRSGSGRRSTSRSRSRSRSRSYERDSRRKKPATNWDSKRR